MITTYRNIENQFERNENLNNCKIRHSEKKFIKNMSRELGAERLRFMDDTPLEDVSIRIEGRGTVRKVRRIIEKRVSQKWHSNKGFKANTNLARSTTKSWVRNQFKNIYDYVPEGFHYCA